MRNRRHSSWNEMNLFHGLLFFDIFHFLLIWKIFIKKNFFSSNWYFSNPSYRLFGTTLFGIWNLSYPNSSSRRNWNTKQKHLQSPIFKRRLPNRHDELGRQHCVQNSSQNPSRHMVTSHAASSLTKSEAKKKWRNLCF